jgi:hypothetical protein
VFSLFHKKNCIKSYKISRTFVLEATSNTVTKKLFTQSSKGYQNKSALLSQIETISPTHIIACISNIKIVEELFGEKIFNSTNWGCYFGLYKGIKILTFYHPSVHVGSASLYAMMKVNFEELGWS